MSTNCLSSRYSNTNLISNIVGCVFFLLSTYSGRGGVIYSWNSNNALSINTCLFYNCSCSGYDGWGGGAIIYHETDSNTYLTKICGYRCFSTTQVAYQFAGLFANTGRSQSASLLSFSHCFPYSGIKGYYVIHFNQGATSVGSTNSSSNNLLSGLSVSITNPTGLSMTYITTSNNIAKNGVSFNFWAGYNTRTVSYCNLINNSIETGAHIYNTYDPNWPIGVYTFTYLCSCSNNGYLFYNQPNCLTTVKNSYISHNSSLIYTGASITTQNVFTNNFDCYHSYFTHYYTAFCNSGIPYTGEYHKTYLIFEFFIIPLLFL